MNLVYMRKSRLKINRGKSHNQWMMIYSQKYLMTNNLKILVFIFLLYITVLEFNKTPRESEQNPR